jgi:F0F1-type ATP synthase membrane subunit b/b'
MNISPTFFVSASGLFDFDVTFPAEAILFIILSLIVTFAFLSPISKELDARMEFIDLNFRKATVLLSLAYEKLSVCVQLLLEETDELNRQIKLVKTYTNLKFEEEIFFVQEENKKILTKLKGDLAIKSAYVFSTVVSELTSFTNVFLEKKFQLLD